MNEITRVGVDLAKRVIQVHAVNAADRLVSGRTLARDKFLPWCAQLPPGYVVAMEACSGAHHRARKLQALGLDARLIAAHFVTPYRMQGRGGKNDANDARSSDSKLPRRRAFVDASHRSDRQQASSTNPVSHPCR
jgi:transposase